MRCALRLALCPVPGKRLAPAAPPPPLLLTEIPRWFRTDGVDPGPRDQGPGLRTQGPGLMAQDSGGPRTQDPGLRAQDSGTREDSGPMTQGPSACDKKCQTSSLDSGFWVGATCSGPSENLDPMVLMRHQGQVPGPARLGRWVAGDLLEKKLHGVLAA